LYQNALRILWEFGVTRHVGGVAERRHINYGAGNPLVSGTGADGWRSGPRGGQPPSYGRSGVMANRRLAVGMLLFPGMN
jgi:hypothetical protein